MSQPKRQPESRPPICDYEGSNYRTEFWEQRGRDYEDRVERIALRRLLPRRGWRLLEVGAGFGRLTNEYDGLRQVVLLDYSLSQLQYAQEHLGRSARYVYVAADAYHLPFHPGVFDGATMVRVLHHMAQVETVLAQVRRVLAPNGVFMLEHANKRNLKSMLRYSLKLQDWNPFDPAPGRVRRAEFRLPPRTHPPRAAALRLQRPAAAAGLAVPARAVEGQPAARPADGSRQPVPDQRAALCAQRLRPQRRRSAIRPTIWRATCCSPARSAAAT